MEKKIRVVEFKFSKEELMAMEIVKKVLDEIQTQAYYNEGAFGDCYISTESGEIPYQFCSDAYFILSAMQEDGGVRVG